MYDARKAFERLSNQEKIPSNFKELEPLIDLGYVPVLASVDGISCWFSNHGGQYKTGTIGTFFRSTQDSGWFMPMDGAGNIYRTLIYFASNKDIPTKGLPLAPKEKLLNPWINLWGYKMLMHEKTQDIDTYILIKKVDNPKTKEAEGIIYDVVSIRDNVILGKASYNYTHQMTLALVENWASYEDIEVNQITPEQRVENDLLSEVEEFCYQEAALVPNEYWEEDEATGMKIPMDKWNLKATKTEIAQLGLLEDYTNKLKEMNMEHSTNIALQYLEGFHLKATDTLNDSVEDFKKEIGEQENGKI